MYRKELKIKNTWLEKKDIDMHPTHSKKKKKFFFSLLIHVHNDFNSWLVQI